MKSKLKPKPQNDMTQKWEDIRTPKQIASRGLFWYVAHGSAPYHYSRNPPGHKFTPSCNWLAGSVLFQSGSTYQIIKPSDWYFGHEIPEWFARLELADIAENPDWKTSDFKAEAGELLAKYVQGFKIPPEIEAHKKRVYHFLTKARKVYASYHWPSRDPVPDSGTVTGRAGTGEIHMRMALNYRPGFTPSDLSSRVKMAELHLNRLKERNKTK